MIVLGVDPGTAITGWGVVREEADGRPVLVDYGTIQTPASAPMPERLGRIFQQVKSLIERHRPEVVAVEEVFFSKNVRTALSVGQARGVVLLAAALADRPVHEYTPLQVKQAISGYGGADKRQMQTMVRALLEMREMPQPDDAADALAVAICHCHSRKMRTLGEQA